MTTAPSIVDQVVDQAADRPGGARGLHQRAPAPNRHVARRILGVGSLLWVGTAAVTLLTANTMLIPTLVLLGSFVPPAAFAAWAFQRSGSGILNAQLIFSAFLVGGLLGVLGASVLEAILISPSVYLYFGVALIEEAAKLVALIVISHGLTRRRRQDGLILGASVGFGFAAFESAGYALTALLNVHGLSVENLLRTQLLRGLMAPVGHGLWTAILGGALFAAARNDRLRLTAGVVLTFLGVSLLHALWNAMGGVSATLTLRLTHDRWQHLMLDSGFIARPSGSQVQLYAGIYWVGLVLVSLIGLLWLALQAQSGLGRHRPGRSPGMPGQSPAASEAGAVGAQPA